MTEKFHEVICVERYVTPSNYRTDGLK